MLVRLPVPPPVTPPEDGPGGVPPALWLAAPVFDGAAPPALDVPPLAESVPEAPAEKEPAAPLAPPSAVGSPVLCSAVSQLDSKTSAEAIVTLPTGDPARLVPEGVPRGDSRFVSGKASPTTPAFAAVGLESSTTTGKMCRRRPVD
jgi:hypothetical protein